MIKRFSLFIFLLTILSLPAMAQDNLSREDLQKETQSIRKEIEELNLLLEQTKKNKKNSLGQLAVIHSKIAKREALIKGIAKQVMPFIPIN